VQHQQLGKAATHRVGAPRLPSRPVVPRTARPPVAHQIVVTAAEPRRAKGRDDGRRIRGVVDGAQYLEERCHFGRAVDQRAGLETRGKLDRVECRLEGRHRPSVRDEHGDVVGLHRAPVTADTPPLPDGPDEQPGELLCLADPCRLRARRVSGTRTRTEERHGRVRTRLSLAHSGRRRPARIAGVRALSIGWRR